MDGATETICLSELNEDPLARSPARARLAAAIEALGNAAKQLAAAQEPATRLAAIIAETSLLDTEVTRLRTAEEEQLGAWLAAGGDGPRPVRDPSLVAGEQRLAQLAGDTAAARVTLPATEARFQRCAAMVGELQRSRDEAVCAVAVEAARAFSHASLAVALTKALKREAVLHGLRDELLRRGNRSDALPGAIEAAARIGEIITETKRAVSVHRDSQAAQRLLACLPINPDAQLQNEAGE